MEICGGQTHAIVKYGIDRLLPDGVTLVHGPGCPVCVTPIERIDKALDLARREEVILCSFGDMLRVPGSDRDLLSVKASGLPVATLVILADDRPNWTPENFGYELWDSKISFEFPSVKLLQYQDQWEQLQEDVNPIAHSPFPISQNYSYSDFIGLHQPEEISVPPKRCTRSGGIR